MTEPHPSLLYLWDKRTLYLGPLFESMELSQAAATLAVSLNKPCTFVMAGMSEPITCRSLLLPAGLSITVDTGTTIMANCHLDVLGVDFATLSAQMRHQQGGVAWQLCDEDKFIAAFTDMYQHPRSSAEAYDFLDRLLAASLVHPAPPVAIDQRVVDVIEMIKQTVDDNLSVEDLAAAVNLSVVRLMEVFKKQTGVPIRRYRLWHRLYVTSVRMGWGESLTTAAMAAGFTDSAHCSHTFRSMLGIKPSLILSQPNKIRIISPDTNSLKSTPSDAPEALLYAQSC